MEFLSRPGRNLSKGMSLFMSTFKRNLRRMGSGDGWMMPMLDFLKRPGDFYSNLNTSNGAGSGAGKHRKKRPKKKEKVKLKFRTKFRILISQTSLPFSKKWKRSIGIWSQKGIPMFKFSKDLLIQDLVLMAMGSLLPGVPHVAGTHGIWKSCQITAGPCWELWDPLWG